MSNYPEAKEVARQAISTWNTRDEDQVGTFLVERLDFDYLINRPVSDRVVETEVYRSSYSSEEGLVDGMKQVVQTQKEIFPGYEYVIDEDWILAEGDKVMVKTYFLNHFPFTLKHPIDLLWCFNIHNGKIRSQRHYGELYELPKGLMEVDELTRQKQIKRYIAFLKDKNLIDDPR